MKRKIIQIAGSTHLVSLPKSWIVKNNVKKGDEVEVTEAYDKIIVTAGPGAPEEIIKLDTRDMNRFIFRMLMAVYKSGYDQVELIINDPASLTTLSKQINNMLPGFEIVDQQNDRVIIKNISGIMDSEFDIMLRKIFLVLKSIGNNTHESLKAKDHSKLDEVLILEQTCARFCNLCERIVNKNGYKDTKKVTFLYNVVHELGKLSNQYRYLCRYLVTQKGSSKVNQETILVLEDINLLYNQVYELFYKFDREKVSPIAEKREIIISQCNNLFKNKNTDPKVVHHLVNITDTTFTIMKSYLGMVV
jgi:phosphate uptake regulator